MRNLITLMGKPGAGKDTQCLLLEEREHMSIVMVGGEVRRRSATNKVLAKGQESGALADPEMVNNIVYELLQNTKPDKDIVIDGYPRSIDESDFLEKACKNLNINFSKIVFLSIPDEEVQKRVSLRGRKDDSREILKKRLDVFNTETRPVIDRYKSKNMLIEVDGLGGVEEIHKRIVKALGVHEDTN